MSALPLSDEASRKKNKYPQPFDEWNTNLTGHGDPVGLRERGEGEGR